MADKQKQDPGKAFFAPSSGLIFLCLISYRLSKSSNLVVIGGQKAIYRGFSKHISAD